MQTSFSTGITRFALCACASVVLAACGGGGNSNNAGTAPAGNPPAAATSMTGTVATGNALTNVTVTVTDPTGKTATATTDGHGNYTVPLTGLTAPLLVSAVNGSSLLYSVVASTSTTDGAPVTANVTPLTTAVAALMTKSGNPQDLGEAFPSITPAAVQAAIAALDSAIAPILARNSLSASSFDPVGDAFTANQTGADAVIDSISVAPANSGTGLQITSVADPDTALALHAGVTVSTALAVPQQPASYLVALQGELSQCLSDMQSAGASSQACGAAIDARYLDAGFSQLGQAHTRLGKGATLTGIRTLKFLPAGTLAGVTNPSALVYLLFNDASGTPNFAADIVQQLPDGSWDLIGDQVQYNIRIGPFLGRLQFTDAADAGNGRYEAGLDIRVPVQVPGSSPVSVESALVTGPGLPVDGVSLFTPGAGLGNHLLFPTRTLTAPFLNPPTPPSFPDTGMSTQYKWSWAALSSNASAAVPGTPDYAAAPVDVSGIPQFGVYTVTLYDFNGNQVGTPQRVINTAANVQASAGASVPWQTLGSDVIANLLTPGGTGASTATASNPLNTIATVDWTVPSAGLFYPNPTVSVNSQSAPELTNGIETYQAQPYDVTGTTAPTVNGTSYSATVPGYVDQLTDLAGSQKQAAVQVQLGWQTDGLSYTSTWQYNN